MTEPSFTPEQLQQLTEISRLPPEEQKKVLPDFLKTLSPEQIAHLREQQTKTTSQETSCPFCLIIKKQLHSLVLYDDATMMAVLDIKPATKGHTLVFPKHHVADFSSLSTDLVSQLFTLAQKIAGLLEDLPGCEGTNLFVANGSLAGQTVDHVLIHVIPRYKDDGLHFSWQSTPATTEALQELQQQLTPKLAQPQQPAPTPSSPPSSPLRETDEEPVADF